MTGPIPNKDKEFVTSATGRLGITLEDGKYVAPKNRIPNPQSCMTVYKRMRYNHVKRSDGFEKITGMLDGNPPYNPKKMHQAGLDMTNVNWKDGSAVEKSIVLTYWSLGNEVENIIEFRINLSNDQGQNTEWGRILSEEFDRAIKLWPNFTKYRNLHQKDDVDFGLSPVFWSDEKDWRWKPIDIRDFLVPDQVENNIDSLTVFAIERTFTAQELWEIYEEFEGKKDGVWDSEALGQILYQLANISDERRSSWGSSPGIRDVQKYIRNQDVSYDDVYNDSIKLVSMFQKEFDGKWTHMMIHRSILTDTFPYFVDRQYTRISDALFYYTFYPGAKYIHANKGLGHDIYAAIQAITQLDSSVLDQAKRGGSLLIKSAPTRGQDARQIKFVHGGVIDIGEAKLEENNLASNVGQTVQVSQYFRQKIFSNNNIAGLDPSTPDRNVRSAKQIQIQATKEARVQKNQIAHYYDQDDHFWREVVRKMLNSSKGDPGNDYVALWKKRCIRRGVPEQIFEVAKESLAPDGLPDHIEVYASRTSGSGSQVADQIEMQQMMQILPTLGERGRVAVLMDYIASYRGYRFVNRYFPQEDREQQPTGDDTIASLENNQMAEGKQVIVSPDNNHAVHIPNHIRMLSDWVKQFQQTPPEQDQNHELLFKLDEIFAAAGPHLTRHMLFFSKDPTRKAQMEQYRAQWAMLANFGDMIKNNAQNARQGMQNKQQQISQQQQTMQADMNLKSQETQADIQRKDTKLEADIERNRLRDQNHNLLERQKLNNQHTVDVIGTVQKLATQATKELGNGKTPAI